MASDATYRRSARSVFESGSMWDHVQRGWKEVGSARAVPSRCNNVDVVLTYDLQRLARMSKKRDTETAMADAQVMLSTLAKVLNGQLEYETFAADGTFLKGLKNVTLKEPLESEEVVALAMLIQSGTSDFLRVLPNS